MRFKATRNGLLKDMVGRLQVHIRDLYYFVTIPIRSNCTMRSKYLVTEQVETACKLRQRMKNLPSCTHVLHKTLNKVVSRFCLAKYGEEMYQNL